MKLPQKTINDHAYKIVGQEVYDSISCHLLESVPKENIRTGYSRHVTWVDSAQLIPLKEDSYDKSGDLLKKKYFTYTVINDYHIFCI